MIGEMLWIITIIMLTPFFYFLPSIIAWKNSKRNVTAIFVINLFLGWTLIGWLGSLVWAVLKEK